MAPADQHPTICGPRVPPGDSADTVAEADTGGLVVKIAILLYDQMTALDAIGPYEVLRNVPGAEVHFVASSAGPVRVDSDTLSLHADYGFADVDDAEILVIPGGTHHVAIENDALLDWVRSVDATTRWTTSVCTGSMILGAAGLLEGKRATSHWAWLPEIARYGAVPVSDRVVEDGKVMTAAGVSSGIDMALHLVSRDVGDDVARAIQLGIEYDPEPPFDAGSPEKAPEPIVDLVRAALTEG